MRYGVVLLCLQVSVGFGQISVKISSSGEHPTAPRLPNFLDTINHDFLMCFSSLVSQDRGLNFSRIGAESYLDRTADMSQLSAAEIDYLIPPVHGNAEVIYPQSDYFEYDALTFELASHPMMVIANTLVGGAYHANDTLRLTLFKALDSSSGFVAHAGVENIRSGMFQSTMFMSLLSDRRTFTQLNLGFYDKLTDRHESVAQFSQQFIDNEFMGLALKNNYPNSHLFTRLDIQDSLIRLYRFASQPLTFTTYQSGISLLTFSNDSCYIGRLDREAMIFTGKRYPFDPLRVIAIDDGYWMLAAVNGDAYRWPLGHVLVRFDKAFNLQEAYALPPMRRVINFQIDSDSTFNFMRTNFVNGESSIEFLRFPLDTLRQLPPFCPPVSDRRIPFELVQTLAVRQLPPIPLRVIALNFLNEPLPINRTESPIPIATYDVRLLPQDSVCSTYTPAFGPDLPDAVASVTWQNSIAPSLPQGAYTLSASTNGAPATDIVTVETEQLGCRVTFLDTLTVSTYDRPRLLGEPTIDCQSGFTEVQLIALRDDTGILWPDNGQTHGTRSFSEPGTYTYLSQQGSCRDTAHVTVVAQPCEIGELLPTAFSPNGDGINDEFRCPTSSAWQLTRLDVFDRWGGWINSTERAEGWDGLSTNGQQPVAGTYVYRASLRHAVTGQAQFLRGEVTLVR